MHSVCQLPIQKIFPGWAQTVTPTEARVLDRVSESVDRYGNSITIIQTELARELGINSESVYRAFNRFRKEGLFVTERVTKNNRNISTRVTLTKLFSIPNVRRELFKIVRKVPMSLLNLGYLLSGIVDTPLRIRRDYLIQSPLRNNYVIFRSVTVSSPEPIRTGYRHSLSVRGPSVPKKRVEMKFDRDSICQVLKYEAELERMGETPSGIEAAKLMAMPDECVKQAWSKMKLGKPRNPFAYLMRLCLDWCKANNTKPNWQISDHVRDHDLLAAYRDEVRTALKEQWDKEAADKKAKDATDRAANEYEAEKKWAIGYQNSRAYLKRQELIKQAEEQIAAGTVDTQNINPFLLEVVNTWKKKMQDGPADSAEVINLRRELANLGIHV